MIINARLAVKLATDAIAIAVVGIPVLALYLFGKPYEKGVFCDDDSIRYPLKDSTIPNYLLYIYSIGLPILGINIVEFLHFYDNRSSIKIRGFIFNVYCKLIVFAFGALVSQLLTDIAKYSLGRLRPHFWYVCKPMIDCKLGDHTYHYPIDCTKTDEEQIKDARLSFMSGHSSFSAYCLVYLALYLQARANWRFLGLIRPLLQTLLIYLSIYTGFTRIQDYKHHWSDVLMGLMQGSSVAIIIAYYVSDLFMKKNKFILEEETTGSPDTESVPINYRSCNLELQKTI